jgi:hypothetical protein
MFDQAIGYDSTIIVSLTKLSAYYLSVSRIIDDVQLSSGEKTLIDKDRNIFWSYVSKAAKDTVLWAMDKRQNYIKGGESSLNEWG